MGQLDQLKRDLCPPLDDQLVGQMLDEFRSLERRFVLGDWEPATLDGGQFAEAVARILYHQDASNLNRRKGVAACLKYVEDEDQQRTHSYPDRKSALHTCRVLRAIYKFRSDRGAVHIDPVYTANHLDARLVIESARWVLGEILRVFWTGDRSAVAARVRELLSFDVPVVAEVEGDLLVQRTDLSTAEEVLVLLHHAGDSGLSRTELGRYVQRTQSAVTKAIASLSSTSTREIRRIESGNYRLTDLGSRRVLTQLADQLSL